MNKETLQGSWLQLSGEMKKQWGKLTDDDLKQIEGQRDKLEGTLRKRYGYSRAKASKEVDSFLQDAEGRLSGLQKFLRRRVGEAQERAQDTAGTVRDRVESVRDTVESVRDSVGTAAEDVNEQLRMAAPDEVAYTVEEYPWLAVIGAFIIGVLIGLIVSPNLSQQSPRY
jgi:uncharacterized protein YjbJ (UPF0337 family)